MASGEQRTVGRLRVSVVIPTLNEAKNLPHVLPYIPSWIDEVLLVDGLSTDGTIEIAQRMRPDIVVVQQPRAGKGAALAAGFAAASGDIIVTLDADGSADPREISAYVGALLAGADYAKGSRFLQGGHTDDMEWFRRAGNWGLRVLARMLFGGRYSDLCYGYNAFWRHTLEEMNLGNSAGFEIETKMNLDVLLAGLHVVEIPSQEHRRIHGKSHLRSFPDGLKVLRTILRARLTNGRRAVTVRRPLHTDAAFDANAMEGIIDARQSNTQHYI